jgi:hypothetical protein
MPGTYMVGNQKMTKNRPKSDRFPVKRTEVTKSQENFVGRLSLILKGLITLKTTWKASSSAM